MKKKLMFIVVALGILILLFNYTNKESDISSKVEFTDNHKATEEEKEFDEALDFLDEVLFLDMERKKEDEIYALQTNGLAHDSYHNLNIHGLTSSNTEAVFNMYVSERDYTLSIQQEKETYSTSEGIKVTLGTDKHNNFMGANFKHKGLYYTIQAHIPEDDSLTWKTFKEEIKKMDKENKLYKDMKSLLTKKIEDNFQIPAYFSSNIPLSSIDISYYGTEIKFWKKFEIENSSAKRISSKIEYTVNDEPIRFLEDQKFKDITLSDGTEAVIVNRFDGTTQSSYKNHQNAIAFDHNGLYYKIISANIESPINKSEAKELIKIANGIIEEK